MPTLVTGLPRQMSRREQGAQRAQQQQVAQARVTSASNAAAITVEVDAVSAGVPPDLSNRLTQISDRLDALEQ